MKEKDKEIMTKLYRDIAGILDSREFEYWLDAGALLYRVRDGRNTPWDEDIDLGIHRQPVVDNISSICGQAYNMGYEVLVSNYKVSFRKDDYNLSLLLYEKNGTQYVRHIVFGKRFHLLGNIVNYLFLDGLSTFHHDYFHDSPTKNLLVFFKGVMMRVPKRKYLHDRIVSIFEKLNILDYFHMHYPSHFFDQLEYSDFCGLNVRILTNYKEYLTYTYGEWEIDKPNWDKRKYLLFEE